MPRAPRCSFVSNPANARTTGASRFFFRTNKTKAVRRICVLVVEDCESTAQLTRRPGEGHVSTLDDVSRMEDRTNEMLYRRELELARGPGISVDWTLAKQRWDRASEVRTTALLKAVVRSVDQPNVPGLITDMKELAESADAELSVKLQPLVDGYATWIADLGERRKTEADLQTYTDAAENAVAKGEEVPAPEGRDRGLDLTSTPARVPLRE